MAYKHAILASLLLILAGCESTQVHAKADKQTNAAPKWVMVPPASSNELLYAVGSAPITLNEELARKAAEESARAEIAKLIQVEVNATTEVNIASSNGSISSHFNEAIVNRAPRLELSGIQFKDSYIDKARNSAYILASFDKVQAIADLQTKIHFADGELNAWQSGMGDGLQKLRAAIGFKTQLFERQRLNQQLVFLANEGISLATGISLNNQLADQVLDSLSFSIEGSRDAALESKLAEMLNQQGIRVAASGQSDFSLTYQVRWRAMSRDNMFYSIADANVSLKHKNTILNTFKQKAKGVSSDPDYAKDKAIEKLGELFAQEMSEGLLATL